MYVQCLSISLLMKCILYKNNNYKLYTHYTIMLIGSSYGVKRKKTKGKSKGD